MSGKTTYRLLIVGVVVRALERLVLLELNTEDVRRQPWRLSISVSSNTSGSIITSLIVWGGSAPKGLTVGASLCISAAIAVYSPKS